MAVARGMELLVGPCLKSVRKIPTALLEDVRKTLQAKEPVVPESMDELKWRMFTPEGCHGKIEGISGLHFQEKELEEEESLISKEEAQDSMSTEGNPMLSIFRAGQGPLEIRVDTLGGKSLSISGCTEKHTLGQIKGFLQEMLSARPDELKLLLDGDILDAGDGWSTVTVSEAGIDAPAGSQLLVLRTQSRDSLNELLLRAINDGQDAKAKDFLDSGAGFDLDGMPVFCMGSSLLHLAVRARLEGLALHLIKSGADIHATNENGRRPLAVAAMKGLGRIVAALLDAGAERSHEDMYRWTAGRHAESHLARSAALQNESLEQLERLRD